MLSTQRRRALVRAGYQRLETAYQLVLAARQLSGDAEQTAILDQHLARLQTLMQRVEKAAVQDPEPT